MNALLERLHDALHRQPEHEGWETHADEWAAFTGHTPRAVGHANVRTALARARAHTWLNSGAPITVPATPCHTGGNR